MRRATAYPIATLVALALFTACRAERDAGATTDSTTTRPPRAARAQPLPERLGLGRPATAAEVARLDTDVDTTGASLPPGRGTAAAGAAIYAAKCASCHGARGEGLGPFPRLVQPVGADSFPWAHGDAAYPKTVGNYWPYATTLFDYVSHAMPYPQPRSLGANETYALVAYLLAENGVVPGNATMDAAALRAVHLPMRGRFVRDDRTGGATFR